MEKGNKLSQKGFVVGVAKRSPSENKYSLVQLHSPRAQTSVFAHYMALTQAISAS